MNSPCFANQADVVRRIAEASHLLICLELDTVLPRPEDKSTRATPRLLALLRRLSARKRSTVAILSNRNRAELLAQVGIPGLVYIGNLGLEISGDGFLFVEPTAAGYSAELSQLRHTLADKMRGISGVQMDDEGLTIRVLASQAADAEEVRRLVHETLASANHPFHLTEHDKVYEIRPRVPWTKANALDWIKQHLGEPNALVLYLSDDEKDKDTVATLSNAITIKIGGPAETLARFRLDGRDEIWPLLTWLAETTGVDADGR